MGVAHMKCQNCFGISQSTCSRTHRACDPHEEPSRGGRPRSITPAQQQVCLRAITFSGLDNDVDMRNALVNT